MKQSLQLKLGQHLAMTPQLQQAIRLLQLSTLDLQQEIQTVLESNPMLEMADEAQEAVPAAGEAEAPVQGQDQQEQGPEQESAQIGEDTRELDIDHSGDIPEDLAVDSVWDDVYEGTGSYGSGQSDENREFEQGRTSESLRSYLAWQMDLMPLSERDVQIAAALIDSIDDDGYLTSSLEDILAGFSPELGVELDEVQAVLGFIQNFDPPGVGARDLRESLLLQLKQFKPGTPWLNEARQVLESYIDLLGSHDYPQLMRRTKLAEPQLREVMALIQSLNPRPGGRLANASPEYIAPDVYVKKVRGAWRVELNPEATPRLRINSLYASMMQRAHSSADSTYMKNQLQEARFFLKSLKSRNETLLKVASCIVERQRAFLEYGEEAMKALVLADVAEALGMHESTISRVTTRKYMHTPRGIFELKYFFSSHVSTVGGGECSSTAIRALLKKLIAEENVRKPLSDSKLASILAEQGIQVARRTVAKYREAMAIPPSNERKRLA